MSFPVEAYSQKLIELTQSVGSPDFYSNMSKMLNQVFEFDEFVVLLFNRNANTEMLYRYGTDGVKDKLMGEDSWRYLTRLYVLDPFYRKFVDKGEFGFFTLESIAPEEFAQSYSSYFRFLELCDEAGYLFPIDEDTCLHIDLSHFGSSTPFTSKDIGFLESLFQPISELVRQHLALNTEQTNRTASHVEKVLANFGRDLLTKKEYMVCQLLLQGHSAKGIALIMEIGYETVKMHKKNIYGKAFLSSQSELLALFIDTLQQENLDTEIDHLSDHAKAV